MYNDEKRLENNSSADENKVAALLGSLKRVTAPGDFDLRVRARIAKGRPKQVGSSWFPALVRVAAPAMILVAVGAYFGYIALYQPGNADVPQVEIVETAPAPSQPIDPVVISPVARPAAEAEIGSSPQPDTKPIAGASKKASKPKKPVEQPAGGSVEFAGREANTIVPMVNPGAPLAAPTLSVREVFDSLGVRASYTGAGWRVTSATGRAAAAGVKVGDVIESINGQTVGINTNFDANFVGRTLRVNRDGTAIQISL